MLLRLEGEQRNITLFWDVGAGLSAVLTHYLNDSLQFTNFTEYAISICTSGDFLILEFHESYCFEVKTLIRFFLNDLPL